MYLKNKKVLVLGLGISGLSIVKALDKLQAKIIVYDSKSEEELTDFFDQVKGIELQKYLNNKEINLESIDLIVKSPGITHDIPIIIEAKKRNIEIITDLELAYRIAPTKNIISITGTNGKTTTTTLVGEIFKDKGFNTFVVGNIGIGILDNMVYAKKEDIFIIEASSFQLEDTKSFKPKVSLIINITPDHLTWHGTLENYIKAKKKNIVNQDKDDYTILNYDDKILRNLESQLNSNLIWFSVKEKLDQGIFIEEGYIVIKDKRETVKVMRVGEVTLPGKHNLENILASIAIAWVMKIDMESMKNTIKKFKGVEHRIEYVKTINEVSYYNDSKGTNPDSTIKAIEAINPPIILIAGGYDKGSEFDELIKSFNGKIKELILFGETKEKIKKAAVENGFNNIYLVKDMKEAVKLSFELGIAKDNVLLSPACASWGMYNNFEERGIDFKNSVYNL
ncbi:MAG TPA: UDP-N-acetylmuramoyl-L-alanine--D-glutamate ligase [Tissierellaceae bacterium]|nr:UDP-N-acetylmuramoyl-L-alanine--D-glutamate ligase [Tissierellaceae bacterium]